MPLVMRVVARLGEGFCLGYGSFAGVMKNKLKMAAVTCSPVIVQECLTVRVHASVFECHFLSLSGFQSVAWWESGVHRGQGGVPARGQAPAYRPRSTLPALSRSPQCPSMDVHSFQRKRCSVTFGYFFMGLSPFAVLFSSVSSISNACRNLFKSLEKFCACYEMFSYIHERFFHTYIWPAHVWRMPFLWMAKTACLMSGSPSCQECIAGSGRKCVGSLCVSCHVFF